MVEVGDIVTDVVTDNKVVIVDVSDKTISDIIIRYDFNCNPVTVYEVEKSNGVEYDLNPHDTGVEAVYYDRVMEYMDEVDDEHITQLVDSGTLSVYTFAESRLEEHIRTCS